MVPAMFSAEDCAVEAGPWSSDEADGEASVVDRAVSIESLDAAGASPCVGWF